jgi:hypothetical protein
LVTEKHLAMVGKKTVPMRMVLLTADVHHVRDVLQDADPRFAHETGLAAQYALTILEPRPTTGLPDVVPRVLPTSVLTQSEWTVHRPFTIGEELFATYEIADVRERLGGRFGRSALVRLHTEYRDSAGELVAETNHTVTQYDPRGREGH